MRKSLLVLMMLLTPITAAGYADEDHDWGVAAQQEIRRAPYSGPTPREVPGARVIHTDELKALAGRQPEPVLVDVAAGEGHISLQGAVWLPNAGRGLHYLDPVQAQLGEQLAGLTGGNKSVPLVFFCVNSQCWLSYNASMRAAALGYTEVYWYRGGIEAWRAAGLPLAKLGASPR
jgi:PQQ-dependent catabolism-associated CXXCW motif protein